MAMHLLSSIVPSQRWGIAQVRPAGWALYFKGGWGSGSGAVDHQVALLRRGRRRVSVAILTTQQPQPRLRQGDPARRGGPLLRGLAGYSSADSAATCGPASSATCR